MADDQIVRKIAVIFVTDVVGFSKLMEKNEDATLKSLRSCRDIMDTLFLEHGGRVFNTAGDSVLAEFQSAVSAVLCATEFQKLIKQRNASVEEISQMHFRVGINMGDVIVEGTNLYGDGVNVAARLEALSQPDGVSLSKSIHDFVSQKVELNFADLGNQKVKNTVIHAFDVSIEGVENRVLNAASVKDTDGGIESGKPPTIAVLPFKNMSNDEEQEYFADGVTEDIIGNLSSWKSFPVISRNSSFSFKGRKFKHLKLVNSWALIMQCKAVSEKVVTKFEFLPVWWISKTIKKFGLNAGTVYSMTYLKFKMKSPKKSQHRYCLRLRAKSKIE